MTSSRNERKLTHQVQNERNARANYILIYDVDFLLDFPQNYKICQFPAAKVILQAGTRYKHQQINLKFKLMQQRKAKLSKW